MQGIAWVMGAATLAGACSSDHGGVGGYTLQWPVCGYEVIAARDGEGAWQRVTPDQNGDATFRVTSDRHGIAEMWRGGAHIFHGTASFEPRTTCGSPLEWTLSGSTPPGAFVFVDYFGTSSSSPMYSLGLIATGVHDVVAVLPGAPTKYSIVHDLEISSDRTLDLPVDVNGTDMQLITPVIDSGGADAGYIDSRVVTRNGTIAVVESEGDRVWVPSSALAPGDAVMVRAQGESCAAWRTVNNSVPTLTIPLPTTAQVERGSLRWQGLDAKVWLHLRDPAIPEVGILHGASEEFLERSDDVHELALVDPATLPGWHPGLPRLAPGTPVDWSLDLIRGDIFASDGESCFVTGALTW